MTISLAQDEDISSLLVGLRRLDLACELQARVRKATSCCILYHHTVILPTYLTNYLHTLENVHRLHVSLDAFKLPILFIIIVFCVRSCATTLPPTSHPQTHTQTLG